MPTFEQVIEAVEKFGLLKGVFVCFFFAAHVWIYCLYHGRLKDKDAEINRIAEDNHEYRDRFMELMDRKFNYKKKG